METNTKEGNLYQAAVAAENVSERTGINWEAFTCDYRTEAVGTILAGDFSIPVRYREYVECPTVGIEAGRVRIEIWEGDDGWERNEIRRDSQSCLTFDTLEEAIDDTTERAVFLDLANVRS